MTPARSELNRQAFDYWRTVRSRLPLIVLTFLLVFVCAAILTYLMPRKFCGRVEMVIERNDEDVRIEGHQQKVADSLSDSFFKTQFESITKRKTLDRVADALALQKRWGLPNRQFTINKILANLNMTSSVKSDFITIEYYDEDSRLAADVANAVAESYKTTRLEVGRSRCNSAISRLDSQIETKEAQTDATLAKMMEIKKRLGIVTMPGRNPFRLAGQDNVATVDSATLEDSAHDVYKLKKDVRDTSALIAQFSKVEGDDLIRQAGELHMEDETIRTLTPAYEELLIKKDKMMNEGLGSNHPRMAGVMAQIAKTRTLLLQAATDYRKNLDTKLQILQKQSAEMQSLNEEQRTRSIDDQASNQQFLKVKKEWEVAELELANLKNTRTQKEVERDTSKTPVTIFQAAEPELKPSKPKVMLNLVLGACVGLCLGVGLAFLLEYMDSSLRSLDEVEACLGLPVLAVVPKNVPILPKHRGRSPDSEAYRILRTNLEFDRKYPNANCFSVVSGTAGEGKSTTLVNLAYVYAQAGYNTLIIDADMRRPRMHTFFDAENQKGLSTFLSTNVPLEGTVFHTQVPRLYLMPSGPTPTDCAGMLSSRRFSDLIADVKRRFHIVLVDAPPILAVSDASVIATEVDSCIIVMQHRRLPSQMMLRVKQAVDQIGGRIVGVCMNQVDTQSDDTFGYHTSYQGYEDVPASPALVPA